MSLPHGKKSTRAHYIGGYVVSKGAEYTVNQEGLLHSFDGMPALIEINGEKRWFNKGKLHRDDDLPSIEGGNGRLWHSHGELHRDNDLPAMELWNGSKKWFQYNRPSRAGDKPAVINFEGYEAWFRESEEHRICGPVSSDNKKWELMGVTYISG